MTLELRDSAAPSRPATAAHVQACARDGGALKVLVVVGHPRRQSLCQALAGAYGAGARRAGAEVRELRLCELSFDPNVRSFDPLEQPREDAIVQAQALLVWADHVVFVYPTWWGTIPALLKGFLDRVLAPGFAFADNGPGFAPLLTGRSAELLTTMDTPRWVYRWIYGAPGHKAMARAILGFCGIDVVRRGQLWAGQELGPRGYLLMARRGAATRPQAPRRRPAEAAQVLRKVASWLQALRLQFYPMAWLAYLVGALAALQLEGSFAPAAFWWGLLCLFALEVAAVLTNETYDVETDRRNRNHGPFTGGSRVLIDGKLSLGEVRSAIVAALGVAAGSAAAALAAAPDGAAVLVLAPLTVLALGYTAPPLEPATAAWASSTSGSPTACARCCAASCSRVAPGARPSRGCSACRCSWRCCPASRSRACLTSMPTGLPAKARLPCAPACAAPIGSLRFGPCWRQPRRSR